MKEERENLDYLIVGISFVIFVASVYLVLDDRWLFHIGERQYSATDAVGKISSYQSDVRRKYKRAFYWMPVREEDPVFEEDSLFTGEQSEASVELSSGIVLEVAPKSLIVLRKGVQSDEFVLDVRYGSFLGKVNQSQKLKVSHAGQTTEISGDKATFKIDTTGKSGVGINVVSGKAKVAAKNKTVELSKNQYTDVNKSGDLGQVKELDIELIVPAEGARLWQEEDAPVEFKWRSSKPSEKVRLEVAKDGDFKNLVFKKSLEGEAVQARLANQRGLLHWRIIESDKKTTKVVLRNSTSRFHLLSKSPPRPVSPKDDVEIVIPIHRKQFRANDHSGLRIPISLNWAEDNGWGRFDVEISKSEDFGIGTESYIANAAPMRTKALEQGSYYWRVRYNDPKPGTNHSWSKVASFHVVEKLMDKPLTGPKLSNVELFKVRYKYEVSGEDEDLKVLRKLNSASPQFQWSTIPDASHYLFELSDRKEFDRILTRKSVARTEFNWDQVQPGNYYWRVHAVDILDQPGHYSSTKAIRVVKDLAPAPVIQNRELKILLPYDHEEEATSTTAGHAALRWSSIEEAKRYEIQISPNETFNEPVKRLVSRETGHIWQAPSQGRFYWRVRAVDWDNDPGHFSELGKIEVQSPTWGAPLVEAFDHDRLLVDDDLVEPKVGSPLKKPPRFSWSELSYVKRYQIEISSTESFEEPLLRKIIDSNEYQWSEARPGRYFFRVQGLRSERKRGPFSNSVPIKLLTHELIAKKTDETIQRLLASTDHLRKNVDPVRIEWNKTFVPDQYEVEVSRSDDFGTPVRHLTESSWFDYVPKINGSHFWRVRPLNKLKQPLAPFSSVNRFHFSQKLGMPHPRIASPRNEEPFIITPHLPNLLILTWNKVPGASVYSVEMSQTKDFSTLLFSGKSRSNSFLVKQPPPKGIIYWRVKALSSETESEWCPTESFEVK